MNMPKIDMSSIVSILLAIALAFTSMGGLTANIEIFILRSGGFAHL